MGKEATIINVALEAEKRRLHELNRKIRFDTNLKRIDKYLDEIQKTKKRVEAMEIGLNSVTKENNSKKEEVWHLVLYEIGKDNMLKGPTDNPKKSGVYLCTCIIIYQGNVLKRYLQTMEYNKEKNYWHDVGKERAISHNVLAWTNKIQPCKAEIDYLGGGCFTKKGEPKNMQ